MIENLKYKDEVDKSYGIAGMAISLIACDCEQYMASVSIENGEEQVELSPELFFIRNPRFSAKITWTDLIKQFRIATAMLLGNALCRHYGATDLLQEDSLTQLKDFLVSEGHELCELEDDEINEIFDNSRRYYTRLFSHGGVQTIARDFATTLRVRRRLSSGEILDHLSRLNNI